MSSQRLVVISDLHLGGRPDADGLVGTQICSSYRELTAFIDWLRDSIPEEGPCELVINGDFVDLLAEDNPGAGDLPAREWTADQDEAVRKLNRIVERTRQGAERGPFEALQTFVAAGGDLTVLIGNHDVELALPRVRERLEQLLNGGNGRLRLVYDGEAWTRGDLLIEHGNRYDRWNAVDHSALRQERSMLSRGLEVHEKERKERYFLPPAGSLMVVHVINRLKQAFRFVDLLKPETGAVVPLLLTLDPKVQRVLELILETAPLWDIQTRTRRGGLRGAAEPAHDGNLGGPPVSRASTGYALLREELGEGCEAFLTPSEAQIGGELGSLSLQRMLERVQGFAERIADGAVLLNQLAAGEDDDRLRRLHAALVRLNRDNGFDLKRESEEYANPAAELLKSGRFSTLIFGHTHLPKQLDLRPENGRGGRYLNTGTWADVMRLPEELLTDFETARPGLQQFVADLLNNDHRKYTTRYLTWAEVRMNDGQVREARIHSWCGPGREREPPLTAYAAG